MPGVPLKGCARGNGDGAATSSASGRGSEVIQHFCECKVCEASRWLRTKLMRGQLPPAQESAVRELIRALGGEA